MLKIALIVIWCLLVIPLLAYLIAKAATFGFYSGKRMWYNPQENKDNSKEKEQKHV